MGVRSVGLPGKRRSMAVAALVVLSAASAQGAGQGTRPTGVRDEVLLSGASDVKALCAELHEGDAEAAAAVYVIALASTSWSFAPYDGKRARLVVDAGKGFRAATGAWELAVVPPASGSPLSIAIPASGKEAAQLLRESRAAELQLWLWFRPAALPKQAGKCAEVHGVKGTLVRLGATPLAFALVRGKEQVAAGETDAFAALRAADGPVAAPSVAIGKAVLTGERGNAPEGVARAASALAPKLLECYRHGLDADPELRGTLVVGVVADASGRTSEARAEIDGLGAPEVSACVVARVKAARFPGGEALRFSFPVRFGAAP
jgi:hypothetical protein